jgi:hypothetical protein
MRASARGIRMLMGFLSQVAAVATISTDPGFAQSVGGAGAALHVRLYDALSLPSLCVRTAKRTATEIFARAGVSLKLLECRQETDSRPSECEAPLGAGETAVRLIHSSGSHDTRALGTSYITDDPRQVRLAAVFVDRVEAAAARSGTHAGTLLGRTIAHELGHLLLGSAHSPKGLMRSRWTDRDLRENYRRDYWFAPDQASAMVLRLAASTSFLGEAATATEP